MATQALLTTDLLTFEVADAFEPRFLAPVAHYVHGKLTSERDDYNELSHALRFFHQAGQSDSLWVDTHLIKQAGDLVGCVFLVGGAVDAIENRFHINTPEESLLLKYFHIVNKGQGLGQKWLNEVIIPHYRTRGFRHIYVSSSHPLSFGFYGRWGMEIASYSAPSDNGIYMRQGKSFVINLAE